MQDKQQQQQNQDIKTIFVFGTLKPGHDYAFWNKLVIDHNEKEAKFFPKMKHAIIRDHQVCFAKYPLIQKQKGKFVNGFILNVKDEVWGQFLEICDRIEGYPELYDRVLEDVEVFQGYNKEQDVNLEQLGQEKGDLQKVWLYMLNEKHIEKDKFEVIGNDFKAEDFLRHYNKDDYERAEQEFNKQFKQQ